MNPAAIIFSLLTAAAALLFLWRGWNGHPARLEPGWDRDGLEAELIRFHTPTPLTRRDLLPMLVITAAYAAVAFWGLGDRQGPVEWQRFDRTGAQAVVTLAQEAEPGRIAYFTGPDAGTYRLEGSPDGQDWTLLGELDQTYAQVLRWKDLEPEEAVSVKYLRIRANASPLHLGEIAVWDRDGQRLAFGETTPLTDEQDLVPERFSYLNGTYFDEIYHARTAWEHIEGVWPYEITHPPLGKILIGLGIRLFGMTPFGWRFIGVLFGILMLPILFIFLKNMTGSTRVSSCMTAVFAFDFMHFTQTRIATIDTYSVFFILLMYYFFYRYFTLPWNAPVRKGLRWLFLSGLFFGLGAASKWTVVFGGIGLAMLWCVRLGMCLRWRRVNGVRDSLNDYVVPTVLWSILFFILIPVTVYILAYIPYAKPKGVNSIFSLDYLRIVWDNANYMLNYHGKLDATHPYQSAWYMWILDLRPILYYLEYDGDLRSAFAAFGNPLFWWTGLGAVICLAVKAVRGDRLALVPLLGWIACLAPWIGVTRCAFIYHYFPCTPFLALALGRLGADLENRRPDSRWTLALAGGCLLLFALFYPVLSGMIAPAWYENGLLRWFGGLWPF
jgi:predicted membrane-bound dolichyl-phosphate-mannose-protein mannosyltransferase